MKLRITLCNVPFFMISHLIYVVVNKLNLLRKHIGTEKLITISVKYIKFSFSSVYTYYSIHHIAQAIGVYVKKNIFY